jgi:hypothetical protein
MYLLKSSLTMKKITKYKSATQLKCHPSSAL